jgi:hypothetical protein
MKKALIVIIWAGLAWAQTTINGSRAILGTWDASGAAGTKPFKQGTALPSTCNVGEVFLKTNDPAGRQVYHCTAANTWTRSVYEQGTALPTSCSTGQIFFKTDATAGQNLQLCTAANTWTQMSGGGSSYTFRYGLRDSGGIVDLISHRPNILSQRDDFLMTSTTSGQIGVLGWSSGGTGQSVSYITGVWPNLGVVQVTSGSTSGNIGALRPSNDIASLGQMAARSGPWEIYFVFALPATTSEDFYVGLMSGTTSLPPAAMIGLCYRTSQSDTGWKVFTRANSISALSASDLAAVDTGFHTLLLRADGINPSKVYASLDAGTEVTVCASGCDVTPNSGVFSTDMFPGAAIATQTGAGRSFQLDFFSIFAYLGTNTQRRN